MTRSASSAGVPTRRTRARTSGLLTERARALIANFGVSDEALLDVLTGRASPIGKLPFEIPSSTSAVETQRSDVPYDSPNALYRFGFGRRY